MNKLANMAAVGIGASAFAGLVAFAVEMGNAVDNKTGVEADRNIHKPYGGYEKYLKRPLDVFLSTAALFVLWPVMFTVAVLVRIRLGTPVFFKQERPGRDERIFTIRKFRTMTDARDGEGRLLPDTERLTRLGRVLRATSLDELPELVNIIKGDMAIVGPRPLVPQYLPYFTQEERRRHEVRPGLTGAAQVGGRNALSWEERFRLDVAYAGHITWIGDMKILWKTIWKVLKKEDVIVRGSAGSILDFDTERRMQGACRTR